MSSRRAARARPVQLEAPTDAVLQLGPVYELYAPEGVEDDLAGRVDPKIRRRCQDAYTRARNGFLIAGGHDHTDWRAWGATFPARTPYSLARLRRDDPEAAAALLARCGLPTDWTPRPLEVTP